MLVIILEELNVGQQFFLADLGEFLCVEVKALFPLALSRPFTVVFVKFIARSALVRGLEYLLGYKGGGFLR